MRGLTRKLNRQPKLEEAQSLGRRHTTQLFCAFAVKRGLRVNQYAQESGLVFLVHSIQRKLNTVCHELFKLRLNGIGDAPQTAHGLSLARRALRQRCGTIRAHERLRVHYFYFRARVLNKSQLVFRRRGCVACSKFSVQAAQSTPCAQVFLAVAGA
jgi:hypothetical protein